MNSNDNGQSNYLEQLLLLTKLKFEYLNFDAVFSDETAAYRTPVVPKPGNRLTIRLRTGANNVDRAFMCFDEKELPMTRCSSGEVFDFYSVDIICPEEPLYYYFKLEKDHREYYYSKEGIFKHANPEYCFSVLPNFHTPEWAKGAVMYQIFVDRFCNGDKTNDVADNEYTYLGLKAKSKKWDEPLENMDVCNFYGGDLKGVLDKLDYLKELGIDCIYFNPLFVSPSTHKYDIQDYDYIDPHFGIIVNDSDKVLSDEDTDNLNAEKYIIRTCDKENLEKSNEFFAHVVSEAHKRGIKVILDGVFNHCGAFNKWLDREGFYEKAGYPTGAFNSEKSIYRDYFRWNEGGGYDGWWGHDNHPKLNYEQSEALYKYILEIGRKWVSAPYNCDGWRLDVAADLGLSPEFNHKFWQDFRNAVKKANPRAIILAEHYGDPKPWLMGNEWDTVMNYDAFMEPVTWFLTGMEKHSESRDDGRYNNSSSFEGSMRYYSSRFSYESQSVAMNELSNHDHSRFLTRTNRSVGRLHTVGSAPADINTSKAVMKMAVTIQMTWRGAPTIYYGDEAGLTGWTDPDNRRVYPWGKEDKDILEYHRAMIALHKKYKAISTGSLDYLHLEQGLLCYGRWNEDEKLAVIVNNNEDSRTVVVPLWRMEMLNGEKIYRIMLSREKGFDKTLTEYVISEGVIHFTIEGKTSVVLANRI